MRNSLLLNCTLAFLVAATSVFAQGNDYVVGAQDVLTIQVFDQADLGGKYSVEADGSISFPLVGRVKVSGFTLREVEALLRKELANGYFKNPHVSVAVEQYRSQRIFVVGEVKNPGPYALTGEMTLNEALARAGSTTAAAVGDVLIVRPNSGKAGDAPLRPDTADSAEVSRIDIKALQEGRLSQNVFLRDGDTIWVLKAETIYVSGQVKNPGAYTVQKQTTVLQALSLAGGLTDRGSAGGVKIMRLRDGKQSELKAKPEDFVEPGDTIVVPERFF